MKDLTIEKINIMAGSYDKLVAQNKELQKENRILKQQLEKNQANLLAEENKLSSILTKREYEILSLIAQGLSNKEIAGRLYLTLSTVRTYINHIYQKLDLDAAECKSAVRVQAVLKFLGKD